MENEEKFKQSIKLRGAVLKDSLIIEDLISLFCIMLLGIKNKSTSSSFGNTSKALTFNQKIHLLIDIQAMESSEKNKFIKFMEIRNQFMHNIAAVDFQSCLSYIDGAERFLLKQYPHDTIEKDKEEILFLCYRKMVLDISYSTKKIIDLCDKKFNPDGIKFE